MVNSEFDDDAIVISGMSGKCANSDDIGAFRHQIYNKMDMLSRCTRFQRSPDCPERYGAIPNTDKFDNAFFSIHENHVDIMDPVNRMGMEVVCEALWDAGISLEEIKGSKTCIYTGSCYSESEAKCATSLTPNKNQFLGMTKALMLDKIGYFLEIDGSKFVTDAACSSSMYCIQYAVQALREGKIDYAICTGQNLIMSTGITRQFYLLGVLSISGACRSFDADASGYARSDGVLTVILQRAKSAKRQYARIVEVLTNCDGFKKRGITYPSAEVQKMLFENFYANLDVPLDRIGFMEAHGTGTKVGDPVELSAIESFFCKDRKDPLYIGAVKSNLGHCEGASGMASLIKGCWIIDSNKIAPNIYYRNPHPMVPGLNNGKLEVVTEVIDLPEDKPYIAMSNFGFGGANGHVLLTKPQRRIKKTSPDMYNTKLVCFSGRTQEGVMSIYDDLKSRPFDPDFIALLNSSFGGKTNMLDYKAYCLADNNGYTELKSEEFKGDAKPLICFFHTCGVAGLAPNLMQFKRFKEHIKQIKNIFAVHKIQDTFLMKLAILEGDSFENILLTVVLQTGLIELFKEMKLDISAFAGTGIGELSAAYADGVLKLDQTILIAHRIVELVCKGQSKINGVMLADKIQDVCKMLVPPTKWKLQQNARVHENLAQYFAHVLYKDNIPIHNVDNLLIIGGKASSASRVVSLCDSNSNSSFLHAIGRLHLMSYYKDVNKLFDVEWPVKAQTPMISPLVKWRYKKSWNNCVQTEEPEVQKSHIKLTNADWQSVIGHNIDGRVLFPATGYIRLVMMCFCDALEKPFRLDNVTFHRACPIPPRQDLELTVQIQRATGEFKVTEDLTVVVSGTIQYENNFDKEWAYLPPQPVPKEEDLMNKRDIYKELGLRGYFYQNEFKEMLSCDTNATVAHIKWTEWCPFLDTMLQMKILAEDTRSLFVPTKIRQILFNPDKHLDLVYMRDDVKNAVLPVYHYKELNVIRCGYIEIRGLESTSIPRRRNPVPVLEANRFIPYVGFLDIENAARVLLQIALENSLATHLKILEEFNDVPSSMEPMLPYIQKCINDQPLIQAELHFCSEKNHNLSNSYVFDKNIAADCSNLVAIGYNLSKNDKLCKSLKSAIKVGGYLISREDIYANISIKDMTIICEYTTTTEKIVMLQTAKEIQKYVPIHITENDFEWIENLKTARLEKNCLLLYSENEQNSGIMGLTKCLLRESGSEQITNIAINDNQAPKFDLNLDFYQKQLSKGLCINVFQGGSWGSYRHLLIDTNLTVKTEHSYANNSIRGDLSSLSWFQGILSIPENTQKNMEKIQIYTSALNFKDVMLASGKITVESLDLARDNLDNTLGLEFAGRRENGERVMGITDSGAISNVVQVPKDCIWAISDKWTMEEAATVPCIYLTNIYGLLVRAQLQEGDSILIHSATGGIGLSAINIALFYKCNIFLTVGTSAKKEYILKNYPSIPPSHIGNSRDTSFYEMILKFTYGKGVSVILNSLADEKLQSSVHCLGIGGRFVEIGKFDCSMDSSLSIELVNKNAEYHGVMLDVILKNLGTKLNSLSNLLVKGIEMGYVKPIPHNVFGRDEIESTFRNMITGKHIGKMIINIREEENIKVIVPKTLMCNAKPKVYCNPNGTYILLGGLGGFGLELADFLILRGARKIVLVSRRGITSGYQRLRIKIWSTYGCKVQVSRQDCSTKEGCEKMLEEAQQLGDVLGVFNLAVVLRDALIENQTKESFLESYIPKAQCTILLDKITRVMCPRLQHFVVFSSVSCGRGNAGQTNYGYSNSVMERICEHRMATGLPGKAIQWGVVGDVGIVADYKEQNVDIVIGGTLQQRIASCLETLDMFLLSDDPIVSSMVVAEKQHDAKDDDIISVVSRLLSIKDINTISPASTFPELGMDSMMAVEIKQTLERDFDIFLSPQELRNMNFCNLGALAGNSSETTNNVSTERLNIEPLIKFMANENICNMPIVSMKTTDSPICLYLLPGVEGVSTIFEPFAKHLNMNVKCLQFTFDQIKDTVTEYALQKYHTLKQELTTNKTFFIAAHSLSVTTALETVSLLEKNGYVGTLLVLDGSPLLNKLLNKAFIGSGSDEAIQNGIICNIVSTWLPTNLDLFKTTLISTMSFKEKCQLVINALPAKHRPSDEFLMHLLTTAYKRIRAELNHTFEPRAYKSRIVLCKAAIAMLVDAPKDYGLRDLIGDKIEIMEFGGDHISFLENQTFIKFVENTCNNN